MMWPFNIKEKPENKIKEEVEVRTTLDGEYLLPAIKHTGNDVMTSLFAVVIKLHNRVEALEADLKPKDELKRHVVAVDPFSRSKLIFIQAQHEENKTNE